MEQNSKLEYITINPITTQFKKLKLIQEKMKDVKADQSPSVIKYMMRRKSVEEIQTPLHDVEFNQHLQKKKTLFFKTFQRVSVDPNIKLDEISEEKWSIMANNYKSLIEKSRQSISKPNDKPFEKVQSKSQPQKIQFLTRRQSIEFRLREISNTPNNQSQSISPQKSGQYSSNNNTYIDPNYDRFKKYYKKIGIQGIQQCSEPIKLKFQKLLCNTNQIKKEKSQYSINSNNNSQSPIKKIIRVKSTNQLQYLKEIKAICSVAQNYQQKLKQDDIKEIHQASQQIVSIQADFDKFHHMLTTDLDKLDFDK